MSKVMRRGLHLLIISAITVIFGVLTVFGVSAEVGDTFTVNTIEGAPITYKVTSEGEFPEVEVAKCTDDYEGAVTLPETVVNPNDNLEYRVTSIGNYAFEECFMLKNVTISESVTSVGVLAFACCFDLESITIPDSVTSIGDYAFDNCISLTSITIGDSVESIGEKAFNNCESLTSITIPESVTSIGDFAFEYCTSLTSVTIPDSVTSIGYGAFEVCRSLTSITIGDSVESIGDLAFYGCSNLSEVYCCALEPPCLGRKVFSDCAADIKFYIPDGTKEAYVDAGWPEDDIVEVVKSVEVIDESGHPIEGAKVMIYLKEYTPFALTGGYTNSEGIYTCPVYIPCDTIEVKKSGYQQVETMDVDGFESVVVMEGSSEFTCKTVEGADITYRITSDKTVELLECGQGHKGAVTLPESVINPYDNLEYSVTSIGDPAFKDCHLTGITIPETVTYIGWNAFYNCQRLTSVTIPKSVTSIEGYTFKLCTNLRSLTMPGSITSIGKYAFAYCTSLTNITIPDSVTSIDGNAFKNCTSLSKVYCDGLVPPSLGSDAFDKCPSDLKIYIPDGTKDAYVAAGWPEDNLVCPSIVVL